MKERMFTDTREEGRCCFLQVQGGVIPQKKRISRRRRRLVKKRVRGFDSFFVKKGLRIRFETGEKGILSSLNLEKKQTQLNYKIIRMGKGKNQSNYFF